MQVVTFTPNSFWLVRVFEFFFRFTAFLTGLEVADDGHQFFVVSSDVGVVEIYITDSLGWVDDDDTALNLVTGLDTAAVAGCLSSKVRSATSVVDNSTIGSHHALIGV